jgi:hypothetical protein
MCQYINYVGMVVEVCGIIEIGFTLQKDKDKKEDKNKERSLQNLWEDFDAKRKDNFHV